MHRAALAALLAVGAVLAMDATNAFFLGWLLCAPWRTLMSSNPLPALVIC